MKTLHAKLGELTLENDFLGGARSKSGCAERKAMSDRTDAVPVTRQAQWLGISRSSSVYYLPQPVSAAALALMRSIVAMHLEHPWAGARRLRGRPQARRGAAAADGHCGAVWQAEHQSAHKSYP